MGMHAFRCINKNARVPKLLLLLAVEPLEYLLGLTHRLLLPVAHGRLGDADEVGDNETVVLQAYPHLIPDEKDEIADFLDDTYDDNNE